MKSKRIIVFSFLICLPAFILVSTGAWLIATNVPRAIRTAPSRIGREYRETAESLFEHPALATGEGVRRMGWRQVGKIGGRPWGYAIENENAFVWYQDKESHCRWIERPAITPFPYALVFYWGGGLVGLILMFLSAVAVACLVRFMRERDDFLAATAHDLTTPLVGMRRMIGRDDEEAKRLNERMILLVDNIKDFLQLGGRRKKPDLKSVDIVALTREAYSLFAADYADSEGGPVVFQTFQTGKESKCEVEERNLKMRSAVQHNEERDVHSSTSTLDFDSPVSQSLVMADETMALQILWNLFGNDLKYAAPHGKVEVRFSADEKNVTVEFADEGPGMSARQMRKSFDRYYRAKTVLVSGKGGFGIGLCTAREFARAMGGDLTVRANVPHGCVFVLSLPHP